MCKHLETNTPAYQYTTIIYHLPYYNGFSKGLQLKHLNTGAQLNIVFQYDIPCQLQTFLGCRISGQLAEAVYAD